MDIYLIKQGWYWEIFWSFYELWSHIGGNFLYKNHWGTSKAFIWDQLQSFLTISKWPSLKKWGKKWSKGCYFGSFGAHFGLLGTQEMSYFSLIVILWCSLIDFTKIIIFYKQTKPLEPLNCCIYHSLPCFNWFWTTLLTLGHFKIVTYHCNWSQMKAFDVPQLNLW